MQRSFKRQVTGLQFCMMTQQNIKGEEDFMKRKLKRRNSCSFKQRSMQRDTLFDDLEI